MEMNRRNFVATAALAGGTALLAGVAGGGPVIVSAQEGAASSAAEEKSADVVVVGAGGAGLCAALTAEQGGATVVLLEAMPMVGGATLGSTATNIAGSQMQRDAGVEDSPEQILASYEDDIEDPSVLETAQMYSEHNGETFDWLFGEMGVRAQDNVQFFKPYPVARIVYPIGGGAGLVQTLLGHVEDSPSIELMLNTIATSLVKKDGVVTGVVATAEDGSELRISAKAVILAAGGFAANRDMIPYEPLENVVYYGAVSSDGKAMSLALHAGAMLKDLDVVPVESGALETSPGTGTQLYSVLMQTYAKASGILVGPGGNRIAKEVAAPNEVMVEAFRSQPDSTAYLFMDKASFDVFYAAGTREVGGVFSPQTWDDWVAADGAGLPMIVVADTVDEVAAKAGIDADGLKATIEAFNADAPSGVDSQFQRPIAAAIGDGPYCVVKQNLRYAHSFGGLVANGKLEVLDWTRMPIKGLYAAGQMLRSIRGQVSKPSTSTSFAYTSGRQAAKSALAAL